MRSLGGLIATIILISCNLHAQQLFTMGIKGGIGASTIIARSDNGNHGDLFSPNVSYSFAGYIAGKFSKYNKYLWYAVEPGYILKGAIHYDDIQRKMHYISVSSLFLVYPTRDFCMGIGPELSYLIRANHRYNDEITNKTTNYNAFEYGAALEAGYWVSIPWYIGLRYGIAFNKMTEKPYTINGNTVQISEYNHYLHLSVRLRLYQQRMYGR